MIACTRCGYENHPTSRFCASCGAPTPSPQAAPPAGAGWSAAVPPAAAPPDAPVWPQAAPGHPGAPVAPPDYQPPQPAPAYSQPQAPAPHYAAPAPSPHYGAPSPQPAPQQVSYQQAAQEPQPAAMHSPPAAPVAYGPPPGGPGVEPFAATAPPDEGRVVPHGLVQASSAQAAAAPMLVGDAPRVIAGFLVSYETDLGRAWTLYQGSNKVGRQGASEGLDVQIDHPTTSSRHAIIFASARPGRLQIEDTGSTNGTFIGERRLDPGVRNDLRDGEQVRFGGYSAIVKIV